MDSHATRFFADADFDKLVGDIVALSIFDLNYRDTVRLTIDDDETRLVGGQSDGGRAGRCRVSLLRRHQSGKNSCHRYEEHDAAAGCDLPMIAPRDLWIYHYYPPRCYQRAVRILCTHYPTSIVDARSAPYTAISANDDRFLFNLYLNRMSFASRTQLN